MNLIKYVVIALILVIIAIAIIKSRKKDAHLEVNKLVQCLGGKDNIVRYEVNNSRFVVTLNDVNKADKEAIQKLGAKGILEVDNQLKIILGSDAKKIVKLINNLK